MYFFEGIRYLIGGMIPAAILYILILITLNITRKRPAKFYKRHKFQMLTEYLLLVYLFAILSITGVIFTPYHLAWAKNGISMSQIKVPFAGASLKMVLLNTILFIPYGFLSAACFKKMNWKKAALLAVGTTLTIETLQLFTGRMFESDDLIANTFGTLSGYFIYKGILDCRNTHTHKKRAIQVSITALVCIAYITLILLNATGDTDQADDYAQFHEIGESDKELTEIERITVFHNKNTYELEDKSYEEYYRLLGTKISNISSEYIEQKKKGTIEKIPITKPSSYIMITYHTPQSFQFYNNDALEIKNAKTILYNLATGTLYYQTKDSHSYKKWLLEDSNHLFKPDKRFNEMLSQSN